MRQFELDTFMPFSPKCIYCLQHRTLTYRGCFDKIVCSKNALFSKISKDMSVGNVKPTRSIVSKLEFLREVDFAIGEGRGEVVRVLDTKGEARDEFDVVH